MQTINDKLNLASKSDIKNYLKFDDKKLPSFPQVAAKLLEISTKDTASLPELSKIIETDPGLSVRVLEIVNSAMYGLGREITSLSEAVVFIGLNEIKKLALGITVFEKIFKSGPARQFDRLVFWRHCLSVAVLSMEIAKKIGCHDPEEAYSAGLLHDIGKIFLDIQGRKNYGDFIQTLSISTDLVIEKERRSMGLGHDDIGAFFCSLWKLPENLVTVTKYHHQPFAHLDFSREKMVLISIVSLADFLCWTQGIGSFDIICPPVLPPEVEKTIDLNSLDIITCIHNMNKEVDNISKFYHFVFPSSRQVRKNLLWTSLKLSKTNTQYYYQEKTLTQLQQIPQSRDMALPSDIELDLGKPFAKAKSIKEVLDIVMYQVGCIFQPLNWSILLKDPKTSDLVFSIVVGTNKQTLQGAKLPKGEGIAGHIMETGESLIIEDVEKDNRFSSRIDTYSGFKTRSIIGTPLKTDDKVFGVIELVNRINDDKFTSHDLTILASIAEYAAIAIERSYYNQALKKIATMDSLTGFKNTWSFDRAVSNKDEILRRYGSIFSMLIIDITLSLPANAPIDGSTRDSCLKKLAQVLTRTKRREDDIFRYGENTFILLLPQTYTDGAEIAKHRILNAFYLAVSKDKGPSARINIVPHTVSAGDSGKLRHLIGNFLSESKSPLNENKIENIEDHLHSLLEQANKKEADRIKNKPFFGKTVSLEGKFIRLKTRESGHIRVEKLSIRTIGFKILKSHRLQVNDFLDIQFILDDIKKSLVERRIVVREIKEKFITAEFYNPPPYAKDLGFYLMS